MYFKIERNSNISESNLSGEIVDSVAKLKNENIVERIWEKDHTVWRKDPAEISNRLGWLDCVNFVKNRINEIEIFVDDIKENFKHVLLLGMGGSSLAPEMFAEIFQTPEGYPDLHILDSTDPAAVKEKLNLFNPAETLYIVSTKSGGTVETLSFMKFFYNECIAECGKEEAGKRFAAITDPGSGLEKTATGLNFRKIFLNDPNIGGRYSALSLFGMVPAALVGIDLKRFLNDAERIIAESKNRIGESENSSAVLGAIIGTLADKGKDKLTLFLSDEIREFGGWLEQLIAESVGKEGKGILPVDLEEILPVENYSPDRVFVFVGLKDDDTFTENIDEFKNAGFDVIEIALEDIYNLAGEMFRWEFAVAVASKLLDVQPFDQPNVESAKIVARKMVAEYIEKGSLPEETFYLEEGNLSFSNKTEKKKISEAVAEFIDQAFENGEPLAGKGRSYISLQAFLTPADGTTNIFHEFRTLLQKKYKCAVTFGYGPRFLHSTGQLHKGDAGNGIFIQFIADIKEDLPIPDEAGSDESSITFGVLIHAQAMGDREALKENNRAVCVVKISGDINEGLERLSEEF